MSALNLNSGTFIQTSDRSFRFYGTCEFICLNSIECVEGESCEVNDYYLLVKIPSLKPSVKYVMKLHVVNPDYEDSR